MTLQEFKDELRQAGWDNPNDAQGTNIRELYIKHLPKDHLISELLKDNQKYQDALERIVGGDFLANSENGALASITAIAKKALQD